MNELLRRCAGTYGMFRDFEGILPSVYQAVDVASHRLQQIESARTAILQVEGALDNGDLSRADQLFQGLAGSSSLPPFAQSYLQQTQSLREDLFMYSQAVAIDHGEDLPLSQQLQSLIREVGLLNESGSKRPLTQAYLQHAIKNGVDASGRQLAELPAFQFNEASYRIPTAISERDKLTLITDHIKTIDESLEQVSEVRAIIAQPELLKTAEEVVGGREAAVLKAMAVSIGTAEHIRATLVDTQKTLQPKIAAENRARAQQKAAGEAALRRSTALSLGLHSGQSQAQVKAILAARGYTRIQDEPGQIGPWNCSSDGWKGGQWSTSCISRKADVTVSFVFELGKMYRDADTGALQQVRTVKD